MGSDFSFCHLKLLLSGNVDLFTLPIEFRFVFIQFSIRSNEFFSAWYLGTEESSQYHIFHLTGETKIQVFLGQK